MTRKKTDFKSKADARVAIAKDVLKWIATGEMYVAQSEYVFSDRLISRNDIKENTDLRQKLKEHRKGGACQVCALGAAFLVAVDRFNEVGCNDLLGLDFTDDDDYDREHLSRLPRKSVTGYLKKFFTSKQMDLIEVAFERTACVVGGSDCSDDELGKAASFGYNGVMHSTPKQRLESIMNNIVDNKGTFVP